MSPDGKWLAYQSNESGRNEIYVTTFSNVNAGGRWQISSNAGSRPAWARNGRELVYFTGGVIWSVPIQPTPTFNAGTPQKVFQICAFTGAIGRTYDVTADGERFVVRRTRRSYYDAHGFVGPGALLRIYLADEIFNSLSSWGWVAAGRRVLSSSPTAYTLGVFAS